MVLIIKKSNTAVTSISPVTSVNLKPWFHVQLLHAIILGSGLGYRCQSVCDCRIVSEMSSDEELLLLSPTVSAATISLVAFSCRRKRKHAKWLRMHPLFQRQHKYYVT